MRTHTVYIHSKCGNEVEEVLYDDYGPLLICWACHADFHPSLGDDWDYFKGKTKALDNEGLEAYEWNVAENKEVVRGE